MRSYNASSHAQQAVTFLCLNFGGVSTRHNELPIGVSCPSGIRSQIVCTPSLTLHLLYTHHLFLFFLRPRTSQVAGTARTSTLRTTSRIPHSHPVVLTAGHATTQSIPSRFPASSSRYPFPKCFVTLPMRILYRSTGPPMTLSLTATEQRILASPSCPFQQDCTLDNTDE